MTAVKPKDLTRVQSPSLVGEEELEIAQRSADQHAEKSNTYVKDFVLTKDGYGDGVGYNYDSDTYATRQELMNNGLRPAGDVTFEGTHVHPDGASVILRYTCPVEAVAVATDPEVVHAMAHPRPIADPKD